MIAARTSSMVGRNGMAMAEMFTECDLMCQTTPKFVSETIVVANNTHAHLFIRTSKLNFDQGSMFFFIFDQNIEC